MNMGTVTMTMLFPSKIRNPIVEQRGHYVTDKAFPERNALSANGV
ncbi:MAG: hypothetical protein ACR5LD_05775 [Symbiopectobacterium sp.]